MQALNLNFMAHRRLGSPLGLLVLAAGMVAVSVVAIDYIEVRAELERVQLRQTRQTKPDAPRQRTSASPATLDDAKAMARVSSQLRLPWDAVLREMELRVDPAVAILSVEGQGQTRTLRITGEAKTMADVGAYVNQLRQSSLIDTAYLSGHEEKQAGAVKVIRFSLDAVWRLPS